MAEPYHRYVFDERERRFVGEFEEMYRNEDAEGYDSWHQEDVNTLSRRLSLAVLEGYNFSSVLDVGCGKGSFTALLKKANNRVLGIDGSATAIEKARARHPAVEFRQLGADRLSELAPERFDLVLAMELLSYLEGWREVLAEIASMTELLYLTLYIPPDPIGFVKSFDELREEVGRHFRTETELLVNGEQLLLLGRARG
jgi:2-polyprenyl-3-methyl-5-hydroxy-6-metoxy-1,4-benzoquinol methylase